MSYLSNFPPCFPHSRQNSTKLHWWEGPTAAEPGAASHWTNNAFQHTHWLRSSRGEGPRGQLDCTQLKELSKGSAHVVRQCRLWSGENMNSYWFYKAFFCCFNLFLNTEMRETGSLSSQTDVRLNLTLRVPQQTFSFCLLLLPSKGAL